MTATSTIDRTEVARFDALSARWWDERGPMRVLHRFNPVRLAYIRDAACAHFRRDPATPFALDGLTVVDIGCGGGVLSEPLARLGARVTGLEPAAGNLAVARAHSEEAGLAIDYRGETIEAVVAGGERFDIVLAMEVVEHVADRAAFLRAAAEAVRPGGLLFAATINRTLRSFALAIVGAEYVLGLLPRGTHDYDKLIRPAELAGWCRAAGLGVTDVIGMSYNPFSRTYVLGPDTGVNYIVQAVRDG